MPKARDEKNIQADIEASALRICREATERLTITAIDPMTGEKRTLDLLSQDPAERFAAKEILSHARAVALRTFKKRPRTEMPALPDDLRVSQTR